MFKYFIVLCNILLVFMPNPLYAEPPNDEYSGKVIGSLVTIAINYDLYSKHCLGLSTQRYLNGVDNLLIDKYG